MSCLGDLLYYDADTYDEFILDYVDGTNGICQINKKVGYNADGTTYALSTPQVITYTPYPLIHLTTGDYTVSLPGYSQGYLFVRLMASNIYTSEFATRVEMNSAISQTASDINLSVNQKLTNYSTTTEMNAAIDVKANQITSTVSQTYATKTELNTAKTEIRQTTDSISLTVSQKMNSSDFNQAQIIAQINNGVSSVKIRADNINLSGYLTISSASGTYATLNGLSGGTTTINGACITTGTIKSSNYSSGSTGTSINLSNGVIDSAHFKVNASGNITATGGTIGGFIIGSTKLYNNKSTLSASASGVYIGTDGISLGAGSTFRVTSAGALNASNATISGNITATSGTIGGCTISNGVLTVNNANIASINGNKIDNSSISGSKIGSGTITGSNISSTTRISCGSLGVSATIDCATLSADHVYTPGWSHYEIGNEAGQSYNLIVQHEGQYWRRLRFVGGILIGIDESW